MSAKYFEQDPVHSIIDAQKIKKTSNKTLKGFSKISDSRTTIDLIAENDKVFAVLTTTATEKK